MTASAIASENHPERALPVGGDPADAVEADPPIRATNPAAGVRLPRLDDKSGGELEEMVVLVARQTLWQDS